jgi:hypothetical protein
MPGMQLKNDIIMQKYVPMNAMPLVMTLTFDLISFKMDMAGRAYQDACYQKFGDCTVGGKTFMLLSKLKFCDKQRNRI